MVKILLLVDLSKESERRVLRGLVKYANTRGGCLLYPVSNIPIGTPGYSDQIKEMAANLKVDAIFGSWPDADVCGASELGIPIILRTESREFEDFPMLSGKYEEIGRLAAEFYLKQHYKNYAFVGHKSVIWSEGRFEGYKEALAERGFSPFAFLLRDIIKEWNELTEWLKSLPKPVAVFACNDEMARKVCEICQSQYLSIPDEIALLGADDDEFLCNISYPPISSIRLDFENQGFELGQFIFNSVFSKSISPERIPITPSCITERASTLKHNVQDPFIKQMIEYLDAHYKDETALNDALSKIPLSRRAIEIRFRKELEPLTPVSYLTSLRVKKMCSLLISEDLSVSEAAEQSGLNYVQNVGRVFKKYTGMSPSAYRKLKN